VASNREKFITTPRAEQKSASATDAYNVCATRGFPVPKNKNKKRGWIPAPKNSKAPYLQERNLCYVDCTI